MKELWLYEPGDGIRHTYYWEREGDGRRGRLYSLDGKPLFVYPDPSTIRPGTGEGSNWTRIDDPSLMVADGL